MLQVMNAKVKKVLEFNKILEALTKKASSAAGKEICIKLEPSKDLDEIKHNLIETSDAVGRILRNGNI